MVTVTAEAVTNYEAKCPYCGEVAYSEYQDDWDISENHEYTVKIKCTECEKFYQIDI